MIHKVSGQDPEIQLQKEPNQAEAARPQGYWVGSVLTSRDPAHPENAPIGYLHHRLLGNGFSALTGPACSTSMHMQVIQLLTALRERRSRF